MARWTLFVNIKEFEFSNIKLWFEGRHVVKSRVLGAPWRGQRRERSVSGASGVLVLFCPWCCLHDSSIHENDWIQRICVLCLNCM